MACRWQLEPKDGAGAFKTSYSPDLCTPAPSSGVGFAPNVMMGSGGRAQPFPLLLPAETCSTFCKRKSKKGWETGSSEIIKQFSWHQVPAVIRELFFLLPSGGKVSRRAEMLMEPDVWQSSWHAGCSRKAS